jgi:hypothetical protein
MGWRASDNAIALADAVTPAARNMIFCYPQKSVLVAGAATCRWTRDQRSYQLWHRGYVAVKGGAMDCPYTFMQDMVAGTFRLPWEGQVKVTDGTSCGFPVPTRLFGPKAAKAAE